MQHQNVWLPDGETHLTSWMDKSGEIVDGKGTYQIRKLRVALSHCRSYRTAVDVGAHVGFFSMQLAKHFLRVDAFEPVDAHRECFMLNVPNAEEDAMQHVYLHPCALGEAAGSVRIETASTSSGDSRVGGAGDIPMETLDSFELADVSFIKLDCEGYELFALRGGEATIKRDMPVILVEQKPGRAQRFGLPETGAVTYLEDLGYKCTAVLSGDFVMVPDR